MKNSQDIQNQIKAWSKNKENENPKITQQQYAERFYMDRFLSRIFSQDDDSDWVLKGGTGLIARVPTGRRTFDIDLFNSGFPIANAVEDLKKLAMIDLNDGFTFEFRDLQEVLEGENQPQVEIRRLRFDTVILGKKIGTLKVDLAVGPAPVGSVKIQNPEGGLQIPGFETYPYRLYPIEHQVAEKYCAIVETHGNFPSSRTKDLIDLVIIATTQEINGLDLREALAIEVDRRGLDSSPILNVPSEWESIYLREASGVAACTSHTAMNDALALMETFIEPALEAGHSGKWDPSRLNWIQD